MDRKAWIIIAVCAALLGLNFYYTSKNSEQKRLLEQKTAQVAQVSLPASSVTPAVSSSVTDAVAPVASVVPGILEAETPVGMGIKENWILEPASVQGKKHGVKFVFTNIGGSLEYAEMTGQAVDSKLCPDKEVHLNNGAPAGVGALVFNVSLTGSPQFDKGIYTRLPESTTEKLVLIGRASNGLIVRKEFSLVPATGTTVKTVEGNAYMVALKMTIQNPAEVPIKLVDMGVYGGLSGAVNSAEGDIYTHFFHRAADSFSQETTGYFKGGFFGSPQSRAYQVIPDLEYAGVMGQFFVNIVIPKKNANGGVVYAAPRQVALPEMGKLSNSIEMVVTMPVMDLAAKESRELDYDIFMGPKLNQMLGDMNGMLNDVMAYGWLTPISAPMNWLLNVLHGVFGNWGWAIIGMTIVVRGIIWPLHRKSYMSMKRMSQLQPLMKELKEKYPNDPNKLNMEMMKLYQKFGINPVSGCLPMIIQIPIFFAFYRVLQSATELRGEPFIFWVKDLARPDTVFDISLPFSVPFIGTELPVNILPILMGITMVVQMRLTPQTGDKMQQRIMNLMPIMFFAFCYNFASALALYWTTQNIISIGQTYLIRRLPEPKLEKKPKKPGFFQRLMDQQRMMMESQQAGKGGASTKGSGMRNITPKKKD